MRELNFLEAYQRRSARDYRERVMAHDKAACAEVARRWGEDYWDGDRRHGYGGYRYDGRWRPIARDLAAFYGLAPGARVLDVGCGKAHLLHELAQEVPGLEVAGLDVSAYALAHAPDEVKPFLREGSATSLPWPDASFDLVISVNTLHNLGVVDLARAVKELQRVGRGQKWLCVESYRDEREKVNLLYWQLTCESFFRPEGWKFLLGEWGYDGDVGFIFFE